MCTHMCLCALEGGGGWQQMITSFFRRGRRGGLGTHSCGSASLWKVVFLMLFDSVLYLLPLPPYLSFRPTNVVLLNSFTRPRKRTLEEGCVCTAPKLYRDRFLMLEGVSFTRQINPTFPVLS